MSVKRFCFSFVSKSFPMMLRISCIIETRSLMSFSPIIASGITSDVPLPTFSKVTSAMRCFVPMSLVSPESVRFSTLSSISILFAMVLNAPSLNESSSACDTALLSRKRSRIRPTNSPTRSVIGCFSIYELYSHSAFCMEIASSGCAALYMLDPSYIPSKEVPFTASRNATAPLSKKSSANSSSFVINRAASVSSKPLAASRNSRRNTLIFSASVGASPTSD